MFILKLMKLYLIKKSHNITYSELYRNNYNGLMLEYIIASILPSAKLNSNKFDKKDPMTYNHDIIYNNMLIEVKSERPSTWLNFNIKSYIEGNNVFFNKVINLKTFKSYMVRSRNIKGSSHYYDHRKTIEEDLIII